MSKEKIRYVRHEDGDDYINEQDMLSIIYRYTNKLQQKDKVIEIYKKSFYKLAGKLTNDYNTYKVGHEAMEELERDLTQKENKE